MEDEVADDAAVVGVHSRTERVENSGDADFDFVMIAVGIHLRGSSSKGTYAVREEGTTIGIVRGKHKFSGWQTNRDIMYHNE